MPNSGKALAGREACNAWAGACQLCAMHGSDLKPPVSLDCSMEAQGGGAVELPEVPLVAQPSSPRRPRGVKFARQQDLMSKWGWILSLCLVPLLIMAYMLTSQVSARFGAQALIC